MNQYQFATCTTGMLTYSSSVLYGPAAQLSMVISSASSMSAKNAYNASHCATLQPGGFDFRKLFTCVLV